MTRKALYLLAAAVGILGFSVVSLDFAKAQAPSQAITISPASTSIAVDAGSSVSKSFEVINGGENSYKVKLSVSPYHVTGEEYSPEFTQLPGTVDASEWVTLSTEESSVEGSKLLAIDYTVSVPDGTAPGGYYAVIFAQTAQEDASKGGVVPNNRVGNILYITVNGDVKTSGAVTGNTIPKFTFASSIPLSVKVTNDGGIHFETKVLFVIKDLSGKEVYKYEANRIVLPSTVREIADTWNNTLPVGIYTIERQATVGGDTITLDKQQVIVASPWFTICVVIFLGSIIALFVLRVRQRKKDK